MNDIEKLLSEVRRHDRSWLHSPIHNRPVTQAKPFALHLVGTSMEIDIFDFIDEWGVNAQTISNELKRNNNPSSILLRINSPGGDPFEALAIYNLLKETGAQITTRAISVAASAASIVFAAGDVREVYENSFIMIHNAWTASVGDKEAFDKITKLLSKTDGVIAATLAASANVSRDAVLEMMSAETWMDGAEATDNGFATKLLEGEPSEDDAGIANNIWDFPNYGKLPAELKHQASADDFTRTGVTDRKTAERYLMRNAGISRSVARGIIQACAKPSEDDTDRLHAVEIENGLKSLLETLREACRNA